MTTVTVEHKEPKREPTCKQSLQVEQEPVAKVVSTAPERIWLDLGFDASDEAEISFNDLVDVTWSFDNATGYGIEYVRADTTPSQPKEPEQEPYAWEFAGTIFHDRKEAFDWYERGDISDIPPLALYTKPQQRKETK